MPGWDCHGLPIELKALGNVKDKSPLEIRQRAKKFATEAIRKQKISFESWAVTGSWNDTNQTYRTFDKQYVQNQLKMFFKMYQRGLIFRDLKPVYFSPSSRTALAEAELEYDENFISPSLYFRCELTTGENLGFGSEKIYALIWTTSPWTLPANQAICYSKDLKYCIAKINGDNFIVCVDTIQNLQKELDTEIEIVKSIDSKQLEKLHYRHPLNENEILPFYEASHVQADKGTGLVHTAPSHGQDDFLVFLNKKIPLKCLVNENGCYNDLAPAFLRNKEVLGDGNKLIINHVEKSSNVVKLKEIKHSYPIDWRTKSPVIILASEQWFINTEKIKAKAIDELEMVKIFPEKSSKISKSVLKTQLEKRPYWCISRQRCWGVPIPVLYDSEKKPIIDENLINHYVKLIDETGSIDFWWERDVNELIPSEFKNIDGIQKGNDILDIWFDSGISWSHALENEKVADLYLEGVDQFTGWFQSSLMTSVGIRDIAPYKNIFVHGFAVDEKGRKMSKSLGNITSPDAIVKKYGIDVMRLWIAAHATQHALIPVSNKLLDDSANNLVKIRSTLKYLLGVIGSDFDCKLESPPRQHLDKYILHQLSEYVRNAQNLYENFQFNRIIAMANNFINTDLSSCYLHLVKDRLYCGNDEEHRQIRQILSNCYSQLAKSLWPITPFLIEESWSYLNPSSCSFYKNTFDDQNVWNFSDSKEIVDSAMAVKKILCSSLSDINTLKLNVTIEGNDDNLKMLMVSQKVFLLFNLFHFHIFSFISLKASSSNAQHSGSRQ